MNSIDFDFGDDDYDDVLSNTGWNNHAQVNMAQVENIEGSLNFNDPEAIFEFALHGINISGVYLDYIRAFQHEINEVANDFCNSLCTI